MYFWGIFIKVHKQPQQLKCPLQYESTKIFLISLQPELLKNYEIRANKLGEIKINSFDTNDGQYSKRYLAKNFTWYAINKTNERR